MAGSWRHQHGGTDVYDDCCQTAKPYDVRLDHSHRAPMGHVWRVKVDGVWRDTWLQSEAEAWAYVAGYRQAKDEA